MTTQKLMFAALCTALVAAAAGARAMPSATQDACVFSKYEASTVRAYSVEENFGYGSYTQRRGAQLFVPAREGLTEQWLAREVQGALAAQNGATCKPPVKDLKVQVVSAGPGFWVQLVAANERSGGEVLRWAQALVASRSLAGK